MEQINYKYQLFNLRILFFVFLNCFWVVINNLLFDEQWTASSYLFFGGGLLVIDFFVFPHLIILFKRDGRIILSKDELNIIYKKEQKIKIENVIHVTYNTMSTMNVKFGVLMLELKQGKDIKIYFEDINNSNEEFYFDIYKKINRGIESKYLGKVEGN